MAVKSIFKVLDDANSGNLKDLEAELVGMIKRLSDAEWSTSKISAVMLMPAIYIWISPVGQKEIMKYYLLAITHENHSL